VITMILGGFHGNRTIGTASFKVLVSPLLLVSVGWAVGCDSLISKTHHAPEPK
jgi:hypothetical protein